MDDKLHIAVPHLEHAHARPFFELEKLILNNQIKIESWFREAWQTHPPVFSSSVDLRNAGFKLGAVDANVFPAGYNNLNPDFFPMCILAAQHFLNEHYPNCKNILIIPENHTRNPHYYQSIANLKQIIENAGYAVKIGTLLDEEGVINVSMEGNQTLSLYPIKRVDDQLAIEGFTPCLVLLNNDLSEGVPDILQGIKQPIEPSASLGWSTRSKAVHFSFYSQICKSFAELIGIDVWQICPLFLEQENVDFVKREGIDELIQKVESLLTQIQHKYHEYHIEFAPFVVVKADAGTYGMGVMPVHDPAQLRNMNRKQRISMSTRKGGQSVDRVIIQEGIPTFETVGKAHNVAEPVVYMLGQHVIGGFYRVHQGRDIFENLNSPGMHFEKLSFAECCNNPNSRANSHDVQNQFYVYSVIARLAALAISYEKVAKS
ncbi:MAG: glutamate--cysteine ligase [Candidatus Berkiella sp.]